MTARMTDRGLRVLIVLGTSTGGIGQHVRSLVDGLVARGHRVVVAARPRPSELLRFTAVGARFVAAPSAYHSVPATSPSRASWPLGQGADVVHAHGFRAGLVALAPAPGTAGRSRASRTGVPLVVTWHNQVLATGLTGAAMHRVEALVARGATLSLGASEDLVRQARSVQADGRGSVLWRRRVPAGSSVTGRSVRSELAVGECTDGPGSRTAAPAEGLPDVGASPRSAQQSLGAAGAGGRR